MNAALYARVSTREQSADMQLAAMRKYSEMQGWSISKEYVDEGLSGADRTRPALKQLLDDVHGWGEGMKPGVVLVWKLDRLARSLKHLIELTELFQNRRVEFVSITEKFDTTSPAGQLLLHICGALSEFERSLIRERIKSGIARAKERGVRWGPKPIPLPIHEAAELLAQGKSLRQAAAATGLKVTTLYRRLHPRPATHSRHKRTILGSP